MPIDNNEEDEIHCNRFFGQRKKTKKKGKKMNGVIYLNKINEGIKKYLENNKDMKVSEKKIRKIIDRLNLEYFASLWMEQKKLLDIIKENDGHYKQIAKIVEDML